jgi:hypothetical protein
MVPGVLWPAQAQAQALNHGMFAEQLHAGALMVNAPQ